MTTMLPIAPYAFSHNDKVSMIDWNSLRVCPSPEATIKLILSIDSAFKSCIRFRFSVKDLY